MDGWLAGYAAFLVLELGNVSELHCTSVRLCFSSAPTSLKYLLLFCMSEPLHICFSGVFNWILDPRL